MLEPLVEAARSRERELAIIGIEAGEAPAGVESVPKQFHDAAVTAAEVDSSAVAREGTGPEDVPRFEGSPQRRCGLERRQPKIPSQQASVDRQGVEY